MMVLFIEIGKNGIVVSLGEEGRRITRLGLVIFRK